AIRNAACTGDCGLTELECTQQRIQPEAWHRGVLAEVSGTPEILADTVLAVRDRHLEQLRGRLELADQLHRESLAAPEPVDTAHRYCILCGHQAQPGHTCDPAGLRTVYGNLVERAERK